MSTTYSECVPVALKYPVCNAHAPYCHLWSGRFCNNFPHYLIKGKISETIVANDDQKDATIIVYLFIYS